MGEFLEMVNKAYIFNLEDEGGIIKSVFTPFILRHREVDVKSKFINFYEFSGEDKPQTNN